MGNKQTTTPERLSKVNSIGKLNNDIDTYNTNLMKNHSMKALGFLVQFEEVNGKGFKGIFGAMFFRKAIEKTQIKTNILVNEQFYSILLTVAEMYTFAELMNRHAEDQKSEIKTGMNMSPQCDEDQECPLCLNSRITILLPCLHGYCNECMNEWVEQQGHKSCPMCRKDLEGTKSKLNKEVLQIENDEQSIHEQVKQEIIAFILSKNKDIPLANIKRIEDPPVINENPKLQGGGEEGQEEEQKEEQEEEEQKEESVE